MAEETKSKNHTPVLAWISLGLSIVGLVISALPYRSLFPDAAATAGVVFIVLPVAMATQILGMLALFKPLSSKVVGVIAVVINGVVFLQILYVLMASLIPG